MGKLWLLSCNALEEALRRKVIYILVFVALVFGIQTLYGLVYMSMAETAGETEMLSQMRGQVVLSLFGIMDFFASLLAIFLGSVSLSTEMKTRTIVPVLSRPVGRLSFFFAKWLGTVGFLTLFLGCGVLAGLAVAVYWELHPSLPFFLGILQMFLGVAILCAMALGLSSFLHPVSAGGLALLLTVLPALVGELASHPNALLSIAGSAGRYIAPAAMEESLLESGLLKGLTDPDYGLYVAILMENALYAFAAVLAGALVFRRREIVLK